MRNRFFLLIISALLFLSNPLFSQNRTQVKDIKGVQTKTLQSKILDEERTIYVYIPNGSHSSDLPVIYILDGNSPNLFQEAIEYANSKPHIVVGVSTRQNRNRDMIPEKISTRAGSGGSKQFLEFLIEELQPHINQNYQSNGESILFGASNSGLFVIYALLENPDGFFGYIANSPMIGHCKEFMTKKLNGFNELTKLQNKSLFIYWGMKDSYKQVTVYLPPYIELISNRLPGLSLKNVPLENKGHVPAGGVLEGLKFIYE